MVPRCGEGEIPASSSHVMKWMPDLSETCDPSRRQWTRIYWDVPTPGAGMHAYLRMTPDFMDLSATRFAHGISVGGEMYMGLGADKGASAKVAARSLAAQVDAFMDALVQAHSLDGPSAAIAGGDAAATRKWTGISSIESAYGTGLHVCLAPRFMDLSKTAFPGGLPLGGQTFPSLKKAQNYANLIERFMDALMRELREDVAEKQDQQRLRSPSSDVPRKLNDDRALA